MSAPIRLRVLVSAYACEPGKGSEPGVGWNVARELAKYHDIWVLTRENNRAPIESALREQPVSGLRAVFYDLPPWLRWYKRGKVGLQIYYYLWQIGAYFVARRLHSEIEFSIIHHVTIAKYWTPSLLALLPVPFVWGPVGGGESAPLAFWRDWSFGAKAYESLRVLARWLGEHDPLVRLTLSRSTLVLAKTEETAARLRRLRAQHIDILPGESLSEQDADRLAQYPPSPCGRLRFVGIGTLLHLKGFDLGLRAFAQAQLRDAELWIIGDGPERTRLAALSRELGISERVRFLGRLPRTETLERLRDVHALIHPTLHDSGGWVCAEAMMAGRPMVCLDIGGPATQITVQTGFKVPAQDPRQAVREIADAMRRLACDVELRRSMGEAGRLRAQAFCRWESRGRLLDAFYRQALEGSARGVCGSGRAPQGLPGSHL
jgi:glycosyltransferase involved in cell wall biosynthesis